MLQQPQQQPPIPIYTPIVPNRLFADFPPLTLEKIEELRLPVTHRASPHHSDMVDRVVCGDRYKIVTQIGSGSFGKIYKGRCLNTGKEVAIKRETLPYKFLNLERDIYNRLREVTGIPSIIHFAEEKPERFLVMDLLGPSLEDAFIACGSIFNLKTVLLIADQVLTILQALHNVGYIHRDLKPENLCLGRSAEYKSHQIHLIDFGLAKRYIDEATQSHICRTSGHQMNGTIRYASINAHIGIELSRRDDLESLGYILIYFLKGKLPWQGLPLSTKEEKTREVSRVKRSTYIHQLCEGLPHTFRLYMDYVKHLRFHETPDYYYLQGLFKQCFIDHRFSYNYNFDWIDKLLK